MQPDAKAQDRTEDYINIYTDLNIVDKQAMDILFASPGVDVLQCTECTRLDRLRTRARRSQVWCLEMWLTINHGDY